MLPFRHVDTERNESCCLGRLSGLGIGRVQLERRTAEGQRILRDNLHTVFEELRPLMEQARSAESHGLSLSWLRTPQQQTPNQQQASPLPPPSSQQRQNIPVTHPSSGESFVITVDTEQESNSHHYHHPHHHNQHQHSTNMASTPNTTTAENFLNNIREAAAAHHAEHQPNNNNNNVQEGKVLLCLSFRYLFLVLLVDIPYFLAYRTHPIFYADFLGKKVILVYFIMHLLNKKLIDFSGNSYVTNNLISKNILSYIKDINLHPQIHKNRHHRS